ncbi:Rap guanine nucleotide exchange factor 1 [Paragonimus westermani]|uniref:Rap guanine nucleotide exchange factor 1 n=1 Tax=Paragonimus westermani TaxID=34504 RepID=A0A5J4P5Y3_9TREM|nr:Rap guanine nucleotide exchange factor 1 [Paragonimus westermani]
MLSRQSDSLEQKLDGDLLLMDASNKPLSSVPSQVDVGITSVSANVAATFVDDDRSSPSSSGRKDKKANLSRIRFPLSHSAFNKMLDGIFRRKKKVRLPALNFSKLYSELLVDLAYTANLFKLEHQCEANRQDTFRQLGECAHLIRGLVASGAACIQPVEVVSVDPNGSNVFTVPHRSRLVMDELSRFHDAYVRFVDWITDSSRILESKPPSENAIDGLMQQDVQPNITLNDRMCSQPVGSFAETYGASLFETMQSSALKVFEVLKLCGFTTPVHPNHLESMIRSCTQNSDCSPELNRKDSTAVSCATGSTNRENSGVGVFTDTDRVLLAKLWSHFDVLDGNSRFAEPPPKPPVVPLKKSLSATSDKPMLFAARDALSRASSVRQHCSLLDDPELTAYLQLLASTVQLDKQSSSASCSVSSDLQTSMHTDNRSGLDLNAPDMLDFPHADASDDSGVEPSSPTTVHSDSSGQPQWQIAHRSRTVSTDRLQFIGSKTPNDDLTSPLPAELPNRRLPGDGRLTDSHAIDKVLFDRTAVWMPDPTEFTGVDCTRVGDSFSLLDDHEMQENIATVAMRMQSAECGIPADALDNPLLTQASRLFPQRRLSDTPVCEGRVCSFLSDRTETRGALGSRPVCHSEVKADVKDDSELISANGKTYRRHFQRHIVIQRHKLRQIVIAPSLPDGTGPDLCRTVLTVDDPGGNSSFQNSKLSLRHEASDSTNSPLQNIDLLAENNNHSVDCMDPDNCDWDSDELSVDSSRPQPPPKPPPPKALMLRHGKRPLVRYMFRFGSTFDCPDPDVDRRLSSLLIDLFQSSWHKEESAEGPHQRSKTISYVERYAQPTPVGDLVHRSTCVQQTCTVRMVGGLEGLKTQHNRSDATHTVAHADSLLAGTSPRSSDRCTDEVPFVQTTPGCVSESVNVAQICRERINERTGEEISLSLPRLTDQITLQDHRHGSGCPEILGLVRADEYLVWADTDSPNEVSVHAGCIDALVVYLTSFGKLSPSFYLFFETFLFTYRAFLTPESLLNRLVLRYQLFREPDHGEDAGRKPEETPNSDQIRSKVCSSTASILVTVVSRLNGDVTPSIQRCLSEFRNLLTADKYVSLSRLLDSTIVHQLSFVGRVSQETSITASTHSVSAIDQRSDCAEDYLEFTGQVDDSLPFLQQFDQLDADSDHSSIAHLVGITTLPKMRDKFSLRVKGVRNQKPRHSRANSEAGGSQVATPRSLSPAVIARRNSASSATLFDSNLLSFPAAKLAEQLTYLEARKYYQIKLKELLDIPSLERGEAPSVAACALHFSAVSNWATYQILKAADRDKVANRLLDLMERLDRVKPYMQPPYFSIYRRELEAASPPFIPYLGLMMQNLITLAQGNPLFHTDPPAQLVQQYKLEHGPIVNFWRCWKHFLIIHFIVKQEKTVAKKARYSFKPDPPILRFINDFKDSLPEVDLRRLANRLRRELT